MQVDFKPGLTEDQEKKVRKEIGFAEDPVPFDADVVAKALDHPDVEQVRVFRLKKGMKVDLGGKRYKVTAIRTNGKVTLRPMGGE